MELAFGRGKECVCREKERFNEVTRRVKRVVEIPERHRAPLASFLSLDTELQEAIVNWLVGPESFEASRNLLEAAGVTGEDFREFCQVLLEIAVVPGDDDFLPAVARTAAQLPGVSADPSDILELFIQISQSERILIGGRVARAKWSYPNIVQETAIFSDIRPVFSESSSELELLALVMKHQLQISYRVDSEQMSKYFAMNTQDLYTLRDAVDRAIKKTEVILGAIKTDAPWMEEERDEE